MGLVKGKSNRLRQVRDLVCSRRRCKSPRPASRPILDYRSSQMPQFPALSEAHWLIVSRKPTQFQKSCRNCVMTCVSVPTGIAPTRLITSCRCRATSLVNRTMEGLGRPHATRSPAGIMNSSGAGCAGICDVIAATSTSSRVELKTSAETTRAGRCLALLKSVKGKGTKTTSPRL